MGILCSVVPIPLYLCSRTSLDRNKTRQLKALLDLLPYHLVVHDILSRIIVPLRYSELRNRATLIRAMYGYFRTDRRRARYLIFHRIAEPDIVTPGHLLNNAFVRWQAQRRRMVWSIIDPHRLGYWDCNYFTMIFSYSQLETAIFPRLTNLTSLSVMLSLIGTGDSYALYHRVLLNDSYFPHLSYLLVMAMVRDKDECSTMARFLADVISTRQNTLRKLVYKCRPYSPLYPYIPRPLPGTTTMHLRCRRPFKVEIVGIPWNWRDREDKIEDQNVLVPWEIFEAVGWPEKVRYKWCTHSDTEFKNWTLHGVVCTVRNQFVVHKNKFTD